MDAEKLRSVVPIGVTNRTVCTTSQQASKHTPWQEEITDRATSFSSGSSRENQNQRQLQTAAERTDLAAALRISGANGDGLGRSPGNNNKKTTTTNRREATREKTNVQQ